MPAPVRPPYMQCQAEIHRGLDFLERARHRATRFDPEAADLLDEAIQALNDTRRFLGRDSAEHRPWLSPRYDPDRHASPPRPEEF